MALRRKIPLVILFPQMLFIIFALSACNSQNNVKIADISNSLCWTPSFLELGGELDQPLGCGAAQENAYILCGRAAEQGREFHLLRLSLDNEDAEELTDYAPVPLPEGAEGGVYPSALYVGADGSLWVQEKGAYSFYDLPEGFDEESQRREDFRTGGGSVDSLRQLDRNGGEIQRLELGEFQSFSVDRDGNRYVLAQEELRVLDSAGELLFTLEGEEARGRFVTLGNGAVAVLSEQTLQTVDPDKRGWGEAYSLPSHAEIVWPGGGGWLFCFSGEDALYGWNAAAGEPEIITGWDKSRFHPGSIFYCTPLADGRVLLLLTRDGTVEAAVLSPQESSAAPETIILTYAVLRPESVDWEAVSRFNRTHTDVQLEVKDYSVYDQDGGSGLDKLLVEMAAGAVPDILQMGDLVGGRPPYCQLAERGYLEDLWPWIENDPQLGRGAVMEAPLRAAEVDGGLYMAFDSVRIQTLAGAENVVGDRASWSLADLREALDSLPEEATMMEYFYTKESILYYVLAMSLDSYVDWGAGTCSFDSGEFRNALAFVDSFPAEFNWNDSDAVNMEMCRRWESGLQMLSYQLLDSVDAFQELDAVYGAISGGRAALVGFPVEDGGVGSSFSAGNTRVAMTSVCQDKEAAWEFIREIFLPKYKDESDCPFREGMVELPVNRSDLELLAAVSGENEKEFSPNVFSSVEITLPPLTEEDYQRFLDFYSSIERMELFDDAIYGIVEEQCGPFLAGDKSLEETVELIQKQVNLYLGEQR